MSLVQGLAHRVNAVGAGLPIGLVTAAADRLRRATGLLAATMHASARMRLVICDPRWAGIVHTLDRRECKRPGAPRGTYR